MNAKRSCLMLVLWVSMGVSQDFRPLRGEIRADARTDLSWLTVQLDPAGSRSRGETAAVNSSGGFTYLNVAEGLYTLRVLDAMGDEVLSQPVTVGAVNPLISVQLPKTVTEERPTGETTSVARLRHRPNRQALAAARKAQRFTESGDYEHGAAEWRKAVEADPEFSEAHGNLGAQYVRLNRPVEATLEFARAIALDPFTARHQSNLAVALVQVGRLDEAESWARRAVRRDESNALGHYVLGCVLASSASKIAEGIQQLQIAARQMPSAHLVLAKIYDGQGKNALAAAERRQFREEESARRSPGLSTP